MCEYSLPESRHGVWLCDAATAQFLGFLQRRIRCGFHSRRFCCGAAGGWCGTGHVVGTCPSVGFDEAQNRVLDRHAELLCTILMFFNTHAILNELIMAVVSLSPNMYPHFQYISRSSIAVTVYQLPSHSHGPLLISTFLVLTSKPSSDAAATLLYLMKCTNMIQISKIFLLYHLSSYFLSYLPKGKLKNITNLCEAQERQNHLRYPASRISSWQRPATARPGQVSYVV